MSNVTSPAITVANVKRIGSDDNFRGRTAAAVVASVPADHDWTVRGAVPAAILAALGMTEHPEAQKKSGKETTYGLGFRLLADSVRALVKETKETTPAMRVSLTGTGSAVVPEDHPAYPLLLALLAGDSADSGE